MPQVLFVYDKLPAYISYPAIELPIDYPFRNALTPYFSQYTNTP